MKVLLLLIGAMLLTANLAIANGCDCYKNNKVGIDIQEKINTSDIIFSGRVENIVPITMDEYIVKMLVYDGWKGVNSNTITVLSTSSQEDCGFNFVIGNEYLVLGFYPTFLSNVNTEKYKNKGITPKLSAVSRCDGSVLLSKAGPEYFKELGTPKFTAYKK